MASSRVFAKIKESNCDTLRGSTGTEVRQELQQIFDEELSKLGSEDEKNIISDLLFHATAFAAEQFEENTKLSGFISILLDTHVESMSQGLQLKESLRLLEKKLVAHSVHRPPKTVRIFDPIDLSAIHEFVLDTYFRHYKMYLCVFCKPSLLTITTKPMQVVLPQMPKQFRPLCEAVSESTSSNPISNNEMTETNDPTPVENPLPADDVMSQVESPHQTDNTTDSQPKPKGLKAQVSAITSEVSRLTHSKLDSLEDRITELETQQANAAKGQKTVGKKKG